MDVKNNCAANHVCVPNTYPLQMCVLKALGSRVWWNPLEGFLGSLWNIIYPSLGLKITKPLPLVSVSGYLEKAFAAVEWGSSLLHFHVFMHNISLSKQKAVHPNNGTCVKYCNLIVDKTPSCGMIRAQWRMSLH